MDQPYIDALVNQALGAYKAGGDEGLKRWKQALPAPHLVEFEKHCSDLLLTKIKMIEDHKAIAGLDLSRGPEKADTDQDATQPTDPRKRHTRDRRRTKPL